MHSSKTWIVSSPNRSLINGTKELWDSRAILFALLKRDLKSRYRTSIMGFAWAFAKPLMQLGVYVLVIGSILGASRSIPNFAIFIFVGLMFWNFFSESLILGASSIIAGAGLVTKISFPREILPLASVLIATVNLLIQVPVLVLGYFLVGGRPNFNQFGSVFPLLLSLWLLATAFALILGGLNVYARDVQPLTELLLTLFLYLCPIIYSWTFVKDAVITRFGDDNLFRIYELNPLTQIMTGMQDFFWNGERRFLDGSFAPDYLGSSQVSLWLSVIVSFTFLILAYKLFLKLEPNFAREL